MTMGGDDEMDDKQNRLTTRDLLVGVLVVVLIALSVPLAFITALTGSDASALASGACLLLAVVLILNL